MQCHISPLLVQLLHKGFDSFVLTPCRGFLTLDTLSSGGPKPQGYIHSHWGDLKALNSLRLLLRWVRKAQELKPVIACHCTSRHQAPQFSARKHSPCGQVAWQQPQIHPKFHSRCNQISRRPHRCDWPKSRNCSMFTND